MGAPGRIRTCNLRSRNPLRYPLRHGGSARSLAESREPMDGPGHRQSACRFGESGVYGPVPSTEHAPFDLLPGDRRVLLRPPAAHGASVTLRISPSKNGQQLGVLDAAAFRELPSPSTHRDSH